MDNKIIKSERKVGAWQTKASGMQDKKQLNDHFYDKVHKNKERLINTGTKNNIIRHNPE